jgi:apolipoprotein N-acyltransferase
VSVAASPGIDGGPRSPDGADRAAALLIGALLAHTHQDAPLLAFPALAAWTVLLRGRSLRQAAALGGLAALTEAAAFWTFWLAGPALFLGAAGVHGLFRLAWAVGLAALWRGPRLGVLIGAPALWVALDWSRTLAPLNPVPFGDGFAHHGRLIQVAALGGTHAVAALVVGVAVAAGVSLSTRRPGPGLAGLAALALALGYGELRLREDPVEDARTVRLGLVQGAVPYWLYGLAEGDPVLDRVIDETYLASLGAPPDVDLLVWPETAIARDPTRSAALREALAATDRPPLLAGLPRIEGGRMVRNAAWYLAPGAPPRRYDKRVLVPGLESGLEPGGPPVLLGPEAWPIAVVICWESVFPQQLDHADEAALIAVLTDPGAFGRSAMAEEHARKSILRAVERGRPVLHASQMGPSWLIDARGRVVAAQPEWTRGTVIGSLELGRRPQTPFARTRGAFAPVLAVLALGCLIGARRPRR